MIEARKLRKEYGDTVALEGLDLEIPPGEIYGLIGPNGAGKSTFLRILATLAQPTCGTVRIDGIDVQEDPEAIHRKVGFMPDTYNLYDDMGVADYLEFFARAHCITAADERRARIKETLGLVGLLPKIDARVGSLSRGMRQRLCLARALIHDPDVLLLDEPASGLDPRARIDLRNLLRDLRGRGKTLLVSSHILTELADFCTGIVVIERGILLDAGPIEAILRKMKGGARVKVELRSDPVPAREILLETEGVSGVEVSGTSIRFQFDRGEDELAGINRKLVLADVEVVEFSREKKDLEYIFMQVSGHEVA